MQNKYWDIKIKQICLTNNFFNSGNMVIHISLDAARDNILYHMN